MNGEWISNSPLDKVQDWEMQGLRRWVLKLTLIFCLITWVMLLFMYSPPPIITFDELIYDGAVLTITILGGMGVVYVCAIWGNSKRVVSVLFDLEDLKLKYTDGKVQSVKYEDIYYIGKFNLFGANAFKSFNDPMNKSYSIQCRMTSMNQRPIIPLNTEITHHIIDELRRRGHLP